MLKQFGRCFTVHCCRANMTKKVACNSENETSVSQLIDCDNKISISKIYQNSLLLEGS